MNTSLFELFKIGIGPSSSHTVGPMRAALRFVRELRAKGPLKETTRVVVDLYGSLALTGIGHGTDRAVLLGLTGLMPDAVDAGSAEEVLGEIRSSGSLDVDGLRKIVFNETTDLLFHRDQMYPDADRPTHPNGMRFTAFDDSRVAATEVYYSVGGGFVVSQAEWEASADSSASSVRRVPYPFRSAQQLLRIAESNGLTIADLVLANECSLLADERVNQTIMVFGLVFIVSGLAFKIGVVPFHMWIPDVYQGAPTAVTLMIGGAPKIAAFAITLRLLVEGMIVFAVHWQQMLLILAVLSMALGNITAIAQTSFKRLLGYSTIAQMGYMLLGLLSGVIGGSALSAASAYSSAMFYVLAYTLTVLAAFGILLLLSHGGYEADHLDDLRGLHKRSPWAALVMLVVMFSLTGIPPTIGFFGKLAVINAVIVAGMPWLAVFAVLMSLIGAFYYLRIVKLMYFDEPIMTQPIEASLSMKAVLVLNGALILLLGILPGGLFELCFSAMTRSLAS